MRRRQVQAGDRGGHGDSYDGRRQRGREAGSRHDGVWAATITVPRYTAPGPRELDVSVRDRVGRWAYQSIDNAYTVRDAVVDHQMPVLRSISLSTTSVDVRAASRSITVSVRLTHDLAGATDVMVSPSHAYPDGTFQTADDRYFMEQTSGSPTDATWETTYVIPEARRAAPGTSTSRSTTRPATPRPNSGTGPTTSRP